MSRLPIPHFIQEIKAKLGFDRALTASGADVVDAVNKQSTTDSALESGLAIVANGDTHAAISSGQYVYVKNHASLAEGLYKANAAIATNGVLSGNVTAASGELNTLASTLGELSDRISHVYRFKITSGSYTSGDVIPIVNSFGNDSKIYSENGAIKFAGHYIFILTLNVFSKNTNNRSWMSVVGSNVHKQLIAYGQYTNVTSTSLEELFAGNTISLRTNESIQVNEGAGEDVSYAYIILLSIK